MINTQRSAAVYAASQRQFVTASIASVDVRTMACMVCKVKSSTNITMRVLARSGVKPKKAGVAFRFQVAGLVSMSNAIIAVVNPLARHEIPTDSIAAALQ